MTIKKLREKMLLELADLYPSEEISSFFYLLTEAYLGKSRLDLALNPNLDLKESEVSQFFKALSELKKEYPIQYIIGKTEFMDLIFEVNEHVLIPRPETEELISWILESHHAKTANRILDVGTGSGCIPVVLAKRFTDAAVYAVDISEKALEVARSNADRNKVSVHFMLKDIFEMDSLPENFDVIVSNPPYVRESEKTGMRGNVLKYEPATALYVPDNDPLIFYRHIISLSLTALRTGGMLYFEINQYLGKEVLELLEANGFSKIELKKDIYGADRMIRAVKN